MGMNDGWRTYTQNINIWSQIHPNPKTYEDDDNVKDIHAGILAQDTMMIVIER